MKTLSMGAVCCCAFAAWAAEPKLVKGEVSAEVTTQAKYDDGPSENTCRTAVKVTASSTLKPEGKSSYGAEHLVDGTLKNAWSEGAEDTGVGTTITFTVGPPDTSRPSFEGIFQVFNGYASSEALWKKNARVKKWKVTLNGKPLATVELEDTMAMQVVNLQLIMPRALKQGDALQFELAEVYPGTKFKDTVLSEMAPVCVP